MRGSTCLIVVTLLSTVAFGQSQSTDTQFKKLDGNGDGKLTRDEIPRLFDQLDADKNGMVTPVEAAAYRGERRGRGVAEPGIDAAGGVELVRSRDIRYATTPGVDAKSQSLDIYAPKGARDLPVLVMIHGGGWRGGDKGNRPVGEDLAQRYCPEGFVLVSVNYRLTPAGKHPANIQDVAQAVAWVHDHIADRGGDPKQIFVMGHSAGAHLAALVAANDRWLKAEGKPLSVLKGAVLLDTAAYDIPRYMKEFAESRPGSGMRRLYENAFGDTEEAWRDASPQARVAKGKGIPAMLMFYAGRRMAANTLAPAFVKALRGAGVKAAAIDTVTLEHSEILTTASEKDHPLARMVLRFLKGEDPEKFPARLPAAGEGQASPPKGGPLEAAAVTQPAVPGPGPETSTRPHGAEAKAAGLDPEVLGRLDLTMQQAVAKHEVAGIVGLIFKEGPRGYFEAFGKQDVEAGTPMPKDAIFRLMSMTKPVIAVAALTLLDEGKFTLDEPISKHLPEWAEPMVLEDGKLVPAKSPITPRMLMSHSSGLYYGQIDGGPGSGRRSTASAALAYRASRGENVTLKEYSEAVAQEPLKFHPGTGYNYGVSIDILGRYIEAVAGKPLDEVLRERLFGPLKMNDTDFWVPPAKASRIAQRYQQPKPGTLVAAPERDRPLTEKPSLFLGGHGLVSTAEDYESFCRMILNRGELDGVRVLKPETVDLLFQNHLKGRASGRMQRYGLGGAVDGKGGYSSGGANGTQFWIDRTNKMFGVFMVQTQGYRAPTYNTFRRIVNEAAGVAGREFDGPLGEWDGEDGRTRAAGAAERAAGNGRLRRVFDRLDADNNGSLSKDEYTKSPLADRADFSTADRDGDGSVSFEEALMVLRRQ